MPFRHTKIALLAAALTPLSGSVADACCLTDWLYGRPTPVYAAGYAGYPTYTAARPPGSLPIATPVVGQPAYNAQTSYMLPITTPTASAYSLQRPTYSIDNPSVYTGQPVTSAYTANSVPLSTYRGATTTSNPIYGTGNVYPTNYQARTSYQVPVTTLPPTVNSGAAGVVPVPPSALPATGVAPVYATPVQPRESGLRRFFSNLFGTNYRSSYYPAPVTYYRPATTVDPITGTTVTIQQGCASTVQQLQRTPYNSLQAPMGGATTTVLPPPTTIVPSTGGTCQTTPGYGGNIGQVGGYSSPGYNVAPIPSTSAPLTGSPLTGSAAMGTSPAASADLQPMTQPSLNGAAPQGSAATDSRYGSGYAPSTSVPPVGSDGVPADGQWRLKSSSDPEASRRLDAAAGQTALPPTVPSTVPSASADLNNTSMSPTTRYGAVQPIPAPPSYRSNAAARPSTAPSTSAGMRSSGGFGPTAPPLTRPNGSASPSAGQSTSGYGDTFTARPAPGSNQRPTVTVPVREASMESNYRSGIVTPKPQGRAAADRYEVARPTAPPTGQPKKVNNKWYKAR
ncbi:hypothetical protein [Crateriforma conspicua]|uniref:Uncharacterized protein n=1 Tax=Crateriforma conspicua TaxID=2527996 RepID=A0A5C5XXK3_9PLAN|nr:hypothetical protein [Crateriforma conspicua]TWT68146.1 hypothetical protein Pan14r_03850 [Crateriforma conspicua]